MKDFMFILLLMVLALLVFYYGIEAFVAVNLWIGELMGIGSKRKLDWMKVLMLLQGRTAQMLG